MESIDQSMRYGGGGGTSLTPLAVLVLLAGVVGVLVLPRRYIVVPLFVTAFFVPLSEQVVIAGLNFTFLRLLLIFAWVRVATTEMAAGFGPRLSTMDRLVLAWAVMSSVAFVILWQAGGAVVQRLGFLYDTLGLYFLVRIVLRDQSDVLFAVKTLVIVCGVISLSLLNEKATGRNLFSYFGGVPEYSYIRGGKLRAQGAFAHPILTGTFGATLLPLFVGLWWQGLRPYALLGVLSSSVITIASASSTPLMGYMGGIAALCMWPFRRFMRVFQWGVLCLLVGLHLAMKAPVWALIARIDLVGGSSAAHRYGLIDNTIRRFGDWWLVGSRTVSSWGFEMADTSNQYVDIAVTGGLFSLILFLAIVACGFRMVGLARKAAADERDHEHLVWSLGSALFANVVAFMGISYFDQTIVAWYTLLASIAALPLLQQHRASPPTAPREATEFSMADFALSRFGADRRGPTFWENQHS